MVESLGEIASGMGCLGCFELGVFMGESEQLGLKLAVLVLEVGDGLVGLGQFLVQVRH